VKLSDQAHFVHGDAADLPFDLASFDVAMTIHARMNVPAKDSLDASVQRVLKPGRILVVFDVL
jgi:ubiquinone/menaquinone biosynthesis C-methylase UbiE